MSEQEIRAAFATLQAQIAEIDAAKKEAQLEEIETQRSILRELEEAAGIHTTPVATGGTNTARNYRSDTVDGGVNFRTPGSQTHAIYQVVLSYKLGEVFLVKDVIEKSEALWMKTCPSGKQHTHIGNSRVRSDFKDLVDRKKIVHADGVDGYTRLV